MTIDRAEVTARTVLQTLGGNLDGMGERNGGINLLFLQFGDLKGSEHLSLLGAWLSGKGICSMTLSPVRGQALWPNRHICLPCHPVQTNHNLILPCTYPLQNPRLECWHWQNAQSPSLSLSLFLKISHWNSLCFQPCGISNDT